MASLNLSKVTLGGNVLPNFPSLPTEDILFLGGIIGTILFTILMSSELYKYLRYRTHNDALELSLLGLTGSGVLAVTKDLFLALLVALFVMTVVQTYQLREYPIWSKLTIMTSVVYGLLLGALIVSKFLEQERIFGIALNASFWVLLILGFIFFGRKYILVSRLVSPQYLYLFLYLAGYLLIWWLRIQTYIYEAIFVINIVIYLISGVALDLIMGIKRLEDPEIRVLVDRVTTQIGMKPRIKIGIARAPILNAMAYGPFFDRRIALICSDPSKFTNEDLEGIIGHELSHSYEHHTLILLLIIGVELFIRKVFNIPATTYDYAFKEQEMSFLQFYLLGLVIGAFLLIFVRILEGRADRRTKEAGYGSQLTQALYMLEGFYRGIGGAAGLDVRLLSDKELEQEQWQASMGDAAQELRNFLLRPSKLGLLTNILVSHPHTSFRAAALLNPTISPLKTALLPYSLLVGRGRAMLVKTLDSVEAFLDNRYCSSFGEDAVAEYLQITGTLYGYKRFKNRKILFFPRFRGPKPVVGTVRAIQSTNKISTPVQFMIDPFPLESDGNPSSPSPDTINPQDFDKLFFEEGAMYILKNGTFARLRTFHLKGKKPKIKFEYETNTRVFKKKFLGLLLDDLLAVRGKKALLREEGRIKVVTVLDISLGNNYHSTQFIYDNQGTIQEGLGKDYILEAPPFFVPLDHEKGELAILDWLAAEQIPVTLYTKDELEQGIHCIISEVQASSKVEILKFNNPTKKEILEADEIEGVFFVLKSFIFTRKDQTGLGSRLGTRLFNRNKQTNHINI